MEWQPISTAPKYKHVLVSDGDSVLPSYWGKVSHVPIYGWLDLFRGPEDVELLVEVPTHWMDFPEPPK